MRSVGWRNDEQDMRIFFKSEGNTINVNFIFFFFFFRVSPTQQVPVRPIFSTSTLDLGTVRLILKTWQDKLG